MAIQAYWGPRRVAYGKAVCPWATTPTRGIIAGCGIAVALMGVYTSPSLRAARRVGADHARGFVDDLVAITMGPAEGVSEVLERVTNAMVQELEVRSLKAHPCKVILLASASADRMHLQRHFPGRVQGTSTSRPGARRSSKPASRKRALV